ncbi:MAG: DUF4149 domain-containing protein [Gammaproteobacteria bacterium]|nr:DUF4149 domain-containing protein [Gammaproteobacteria bacterium]
MINLIEIISILTASLIFGGMIFFASFMAPLVFIKLPAETAGKFIREVFPWYYLAFGCLSLLLALLLYANPNKWFISIMLANVFAFALARQWLMPAINATRDVVLQGDATANEKFNTLHRVSVAMNSLQLLSISIVLYFLIK